MMSPWLACKVKLPSKSVIVPVVVPFINTLAPITGSPKLSFTTPLTVMLCAKACTENSIPASHSSRSLFRLFKSFIFMFISLSMNNKIGSLFL